MNHQNFQIHDVFTPLMLGSISLVAFLSLRNTYLAGKARDLCDHLLKTDQISWKASYSLQLLYFIERYRMSNSALLLAIVSITLFGMMTGLAAITSKPWTTDIVVELPRFLMVLGGVTAIAATGLSLWETFISRRSLFSHVAHSIISANIIKTDPVLLATIARIGLLIQKSLDRDLYGKFIEAQRRMGEEC